MTPMRALLGTVLVSLSPVCAAYDANGVSLGASEKAVLERFPAAACKPLQWTSDAADRRCDDPKAVLGGVASRITFYLKQDRVQAFDVRFESKDAERLAAFLKKRYGAPSGETREKLEQRRGGELYKLEWEQGGERAVLTSQSEKRRAFFTVSRGDFEDEIYRVR
jgi:hypothetical protein